MLLNTFAVLLFAVVLLLSGTEGIEPSVHVVYVTLSGAETGWPTTETSLGSLNATVTSTMCGELPRGLECNAFLILVKTSVLAVIVRAEAQSTTDGFTVYSTMSNWASNSNLPLPALMANCQAALGVTVSTLTYSSGDYTVPCRATNTFSFLPSCAVNETPVVTFYVGNSGGSIANVINKYVCGTTSCSGVTVTASTTGTVTTVVVSGSAMGLEAFLYYVASVRAASPLASNTLTTSVGDASAGVSADYIQLTSGGVNATVFSLKENDRYEETYTVPMSCSSGAGFWAFALIAIPILALMVFWYIWHRARHAAKKQVRRLIIDDEMRIMQGYSSTLNLDGAPHTAGAPNDDQNPLTPATQWYMDANGNYYEAPVEDAENGGAPQMGVQDGGGVDAYENSAQQEYVYYEDPATREAYQVLVPQSGSYDQVAGAGTAEVPPNAADASGAGQQLYQYYVDPSTGERYQAPADPNEGDVHDVAATTGVSQEQGQEGTENDVVVDPNDGVADYHSYYQQNDSANGAVDAENVIDQEMNEANLYNGDQYAYTNAGLEAQGEQGGAYVDPNAAEQQYYVDPETGAYYAVVVDPSTGEMYYQPLEREATAQ